MAAGSLLPAKAPKSLKASRNGTTWQSIQAEPVLRVGSILALSGMGEFLATLKDLSWRVAPPPDVHELPAHVIARYGELPAELVRFISSFTRCISPTDEAWFVSANDLSRSEPFRYNEYELMSLEAAGSDAELAAIRAFWQTHFPFFLCVAGSYQYFALSLAGATQGSVVYGYDPEFEECAIVASSLDKFLSAFLAALQSPAPPYPFNLAIPQRAA